MIIPDQFYESDELKVLTAKQREFVLNYLNSGNATQAAIEANYSEKTARVIGPENLSKPAIISALNRARELAQQEAAVDAQEVLQTMKAIRDRCMQAVEVRDREGNPTGEYKFEANAAIKANELLGKHVGLFGNKLEISGKDGGPIQITCMDDLLEAVGNSDSDENIITLTPD